MSEIGSEGELAYCFYLNYKDRVTLPSSRLCEEPVSAVDLTPVRLLLLVKGISRAPGTPGQAPCEAL